ncbi:MAG TPA: response regulator [Patescibacteria group bacterium]|nr:response regulator [Patescibacteria group bacterium]
MPKKILIVEDDKDLLFLLAKKITDAGFVTIKAETGQEALDFLTNEKPDLVLLDILLPDIDGLSVLNEIASKPEMKNLPVIILSNLADEGSREQAAAIGDYEYLVKAKTDLGEVIKKIKEKLQMI